MQIECVKAYKIMLPFTGDFSISRLKGLSSKTVVVEIVADGGQIKGYGEGLPVEFVTGETPESTLENVMLFAEKHDFPWDLSSVFQIWHFVDGLPMGQESNAAICAIETALLDALGKSQNKSVLEYLPKDYRTDTIHYGAALTLGNKERIAELCGLLKNLGIRHVRIKLDHDFDKNKNAIETAVCCLGESCEFRLDPNTVWDRELAYRHIPLIRKCKAKVVEEPMAKGEPGFVEFAEVMRSIDVLMMACESAPTLEDVEVIAEEGFYQMVNVKLCRSGGFRRALKIIKFIRSKGLSFQIGCTLGESGILSSAGRTLCLICKDAKYYDGSYDKFLLKENVTLENVSFGQGGEAGRLEGPGLGMDVSSDKLKRLCDDSSTITIPRP